MRRRFPCTPSSAWSTTPARAAARRRGLQQALDHGGAVLRQPARSLRAAARALARPCARASRRIRSARARIQCPSFVLGTPHRMGHVHLGARGGRFPRQRRRAAQLGPAGRAQRRACVEIIARRLFGSDVLASWLATHAADARSPDARATQHGSLAGLLLLDLRGSWTWPLRGGDLSAVLDLTNATDRDNQCCEVLRAEPQFAVEVDSWLPTLVNLGFTYRWRSRWPPTGTRAP